MIPKENNTIRFAIGSPDKPLSLTWRLWGLGNNIFIGTKNGDKCFKISLYDEKNWRIANVKALNQNDSGVDEVLHSWDNSVEFSPGFTHSVSIAIPKNNSSIKNKAEDSRIIWFKEATEGKCIVFKIYISTPGIKRLELESILKKGDNLVGNIKKQNGNRVWLIEREDILNVSQIEKINSDNSKSGILVVTDNKCSIDGQPTVFDLA